MDLVQKNLLEQVAGLHEVPEGAYNIRANGKRLHETPPPILILSQKRTRTELTSLSNRERSMRAFIFRSF